MVSIRSGIALVSDGELAGVGAGAASFAEFAGFVSEAMPLSVAAGGGEAVSRLPKAGATLEPDGSDAPDEHAQHASTKAKPGKGR